MGPLFWDAPYGTGGVPAGTYHIQMKRELSVTCCTECGFPGYNIRVANGRCSKTVGEERCSGVNAIAANKADWIECMHCQATGYYRNKECPKCKGAIYSHACGMKQRSKSRILGATDSLQDLSSCFLGTTHTPSDGRKHLIVQFHLVQQCRNTITFS